VLNGSARPPVATGCTHYRLRLSAGQTLYVSDNVLDLIRLIDGRRSIQTLSDILAEQQGRPVHPTEIVYLLRRQLVPGGLVELSLPLALPEPKTNQTTGFSAQKALVPNDTHKSLQTSPLGADEPRPRSIVTRPLDVPDDLQWIPPGRRAERLRATRRPPMLKQRMRRASYMNLVATFLVIFAAGAAFAFAHVGFSRASFTPLNVSTLLFGSGSTPTPTVTLQQATPTPKPALPPLKYIVQNGDTFAQIAALFHVNATALLLVNSLSQSPQLHPGQILIIPTVYYAGADPTTLAYPIFYTVRQGDSIYSIAQLFGDTADTVIQYNHISNPSLIQPGNWLIIPPAPAQ
jgi:LysM repeat protein